MATTPTAPKGTGQKPSIDVSWQELAEALSELAAVPAVKGIVGDMFTMKNEKGAPVLLPDAAQPGWFLDSKKYLASAGSGGVKGAKPDAPAKVIEDSPERAKIPNENKWNTGLVFKSLTEWKKEHDRVAALIDGIPELEKNMTRSGEDFYNALRQIDDLERDMYKVFVYAQCEYHTHLENPTANEIWNTVQNLENKFKSATSFLRPAVLEIPEAKLQAFKKEEPRLDVEFGYYLSKIDSERQHTLPTDENRIFEALKPNADISRRLSEKFYNEVMPRPEIKVPGKEEPVKLTGGNYGAFRVSNNREVRKMAFEALFGTFKTYEGIYALMLQEKIQATLRSTDLLKYENPLQAAMAKEGADPKVYDAFLAGMHSEEVRGALHRYMGLKKETLGLDEFNYYDIYASIAPGAELKFTIPEMKDLVLKSLAPMGQKYQDMIRQAYEEGWIDYTKHDGKKEGGYMEEKYANPPFILLNSNGTFGDVTTLSHEAGHAAHTRRTDEENRTYSYFKYPTGIGEIPSTTFALLTTWYAIENAPSKEVELAYLSELLESYRTTSNRQAIFAEFEKIIHDEVQGGGTLTPEFLNATYQKLLQDTYGPDLNVEELYGVEWAYLPHIFLYDFYVQNYTTSQVASIAIARKLKSEDPGFLEKFDAMLGKGGNGEPFQLLQDIGIDMTTTAPYEMFAAEMHRVMDRIEVLQKEIAAEKKE